MSTEKVTRVHQPAFLQTVSIGFKNPEMIADRVAPRMRVAKQSDKYRVFGKNEFLNRVNGENWAPGTVPNAIEYRWSEGTYFADFKKLRMALLDAELANQDNDLDLRSRYTEVVTNALAIRREVRVASLFTTTGNYAANNRLIKAGGAEWDTTLGATPTSTVVIDDIETAIQRAKLTAMVGSGSLSLIVPDLVFDRTMKRNASILERIKYSERGIVTTDLLRALFNVKEVIIAQGMAVTGPEVAGADVLTGFTPAQIWGDAVWVGVLGSPNGGNMEPAFARTFNWQAGTSNQERRVREYRDPDEGKEQSWIEVTECVDEKITFADGGYLISNVLA